MGSGGAMSASRMAVAAVEQALVGVAEELQRHADGQGEVSSVPRLSTRECHVSVPSFSPVPRLVSPGAGEVEGGGIA